MNIAHLVQDGEELKLDIHIVVDLVAHGDRTVADFNGRSADVVAVAGDQRIGLAAVLGRVKRREHIPVVGIVGTQVDVAQTRTDRADSIVVEHLDRHFFGLNQRAAVIAPELAFAGLGIGRLLGHDPVGMLMAGGGDRNCLGVRVVILAGLDF